MIRSRMQRWTTTFKNGSSPHDKERILSAMVAYNEPLLPRENLTAGLLSGRSMTILAEE